MHVVKGPVRLASFSDLVYTDIMYTRKCSQVAIFAKYCKKIAVFSLLREYELVWRSTVYARYFNFCESRTTDGKCKNKTTTQMFVYTLQYFIKDRGPPLLRSYLRPCIVLELDNIYWGGHNKVQGYIVHFLFRGFGDMSP